MHPEVESTNNGAERASRSSVIYRKVSGGSRTDRGAVINISHIKAQEKQMS